MSKLNDIQRSEIIELYLTGNYSQSQIGDKYGVSGVAVHKLLKKNGISGRKSWAQKDYRRCSRCGRKLPMSEFYRDADYWCKECYSKYHKENRNYDYLYKKYDMTETEYLDMFKIQDGKCAICGNEIENERLAVDHNHETGRIRGLLCAKCNSGLGMFNDNIGLLQNAIKYLQKSL
jgi:DNA-directed RNA polymerase subunit RPC12/RpoP